MRLLLCIGFLERRDGPFLGLRDLVNLHVLPRHPSLQVEYYSYRDNLTAALHRHNPTTPGGPLVLLGHSYGSSALVRAAHRSPTIPITHLILLDPVPRWLWGQFQFFSYHLPRNVQNATCLYNPWSLPKSSPIRTATRFQNIQVSSLHAQIPSDPQVQSHILTILNSIFTPAPAPPPIETIKVPPVVRRGL